MLKKIFLCFFVSICIMLVFIGCTNSENVIGIEMNDIITTMEKSDSEDVILKTKDKEITKETLVCCCKFFEHSHIYDNPNSDEILEEVVESFALAEEAKQRGIQIPEEETDEINGYTDEYIQNAYGDDFNDYSLETYKEMCKISRLASEMAFQIQDEIFSGKISIDDKNTKELCKKLTSYSEEVSSKSSNFSDEEKIEGMNEFFTMYDEVEKAYINYLISTHLSSAK